MELQVEVLKVELKGTNTFELRCKAETDSSGEILSESSSMDLSQPGPALTRPQLAKLKTKVRIEEPHLAKFRFRFKKPSPVAALLFTAVKGGAAPSRSKGKLVAKASDTSREEEGELGHCLFPITFRPSESTSLGSLAVKADELVNQTQTSFLTTKLQGTNISKVVGRLLFKVYTHKPVPKKSLLKTHTSYLDLKISQEKFAKPIKSGPSVTELSARENASLCDCAVLPGDSPKINVLFHCAASAKEDHLKDLRPIACIGTSSELREDGFFKDNSSQLVNIVSILKPVSLQCISGNSESSSEVLELHLCGGSKSEALFSSAHTLQTFYPFKHHNWEYNWRWLPGTQTDSLNNFQSTGKESKVILSVVYVPPASDFANHEGLEVLIQHVDLETFAKDRYLIACVQLLDKDEVNVSLGSDATQNSPFKQSVDSQDATGTRNFNIAVMLFGDRRDEESEPELEMTESDVTPAYFFFDINTFFRNKLGENELQISLYSVDKSSTIAWWKDSNIATCSVCLPPGLKKILPNPENQAGVKCNLVNEEITQPEETPLVNSMTVVLRWKTKDMQFLSSATNDAIENLPLVQDLVYSQTETEANSLYNPQAEAPQHSHVYLEEYKTAITKMGLDILKLRQENDQLSKENKRLERHMVEMEASIVVTAADQRKLHPLSKPDLIHRVVELSEYLVNERQSRKGYRDKVRSLQNQLIEKNDIVSQHVRLQEAHEAQQKLVRELQSKVEKYRKCSDTSKKQESVINQLEALLALESGDRRAGNALSIISKENADLRATLREYQDSDPDHRRSLLGEKEETIASLRKELEKMAKQRQNLEEQLDNCEKKTGVKSDTYFEQTTRVYELEQRLKVAEARENTLMNELEENGRRWAQEKARYEILVTELQARWESLNKTKEHVVPDKKSALSLAPSRPLLSQNHQPPSGNYSRDHYREDHHTSHDPHHYSRNNRDSHHTKHNIRESHGTSRNNHDSHHTHHTRNNHDLHHNSRDSHDAYYPQYTSRTDHESHHASRTNHDSHHTSRNNHDSHHASRTNHDSHHTSRNNHDSHYSRDSHASLPYSHNSHDSHSQHSYDSHNSHHSHRRVSNLLSSQSVNSPGKLNVSLDDMITF